MQVDENLVKQITYLVIKEIEKNNNGNYKSSLKEIGKAEKGINSKEIVIGIGPAFCKSIHRTINNLDLKNVLKEVMAGIEEEGMVPRIIRVMKTSDVAFIGKEAAMLSGSGISIGIQSKGTILIHQKDLYPLSNLELFPQAPLVTLEMYRRIGKNAALYAKGMMVKPIEAKNDYTVRAKYQVKAALMHIKETELVVKNKPSIQIDTNF